jgi:gluconokinase
MIKIHAMLALTLKRLLYQGKRESRKHTGLWMSNQTTTACDLPRRWVVMGVSGCGKSEIGRQLAHHLSLTYMEGDDDHPAANVAKMAAGIALDDADRQDWLLKLQSRIRAAKQQGIGLVLSCSALKRRYRDLLRQGDPALIFVHLEGERELIAARMQARGNHFMPLTLLDSQIRDLEPLAADENGIRLDIQLTPEQLIEEIVQRSTALHAIQK